MIQWTHYPCFFLKFLLLMTFWHFLPPSLTYFSLSFLPSLLPYPRLSLPPSLTIGLLFPGVFFFFFPLSIVSFDTPIWFHSCDQCWFKPSRSLLPAPAFSLPQTLKPYLSKTSQDSHLLVSQMQFIQAGLPNILSKAQTISFQFSFSQAFSSLKFPL